MRDRAEGACEKHGIAADIDVGSGRFVRRCQHTVFGMLYAPVTKSLILCAKPGQVRHTHLPYKCFYIHTVVHEGLLYDTLMRLPNFIECANPNRIRNLFERICASNGQPIS